MPSIQKKLYIIIFVLIVIILILIFFLLSSNNEKDLSNNNFEEIINGQRNANYADDLVDGSLNVNFGEVDNQVNINDGVVDNILNNQYQQNNNNIQPDPIETDISNCDFVVWHDPARIQTIYRSNGKKEKEILNDNRCRRFGNLFYEERLFRVDESLEKITKKILLNNGDIKEVITYYDFSGILLTEEYYINDKKDNSLTYLDVEEARNDIHTSLNPLLDQQNITRQQWSNATANLDVFWSLCNYLADGFTDNSIKWIKDDLYLSSSITRKSDNILACGVWDFYPYYITSDATGKTIFDEWVNVDFYNIDWFEKYGYVRDANV